MKSVVSFRPECGQLSADFCHSPSHAQDRRDSTRKPPFPHARPAIELLAAEQRLAFLHSPEVLRGGALLLQGELRDALDRQRASLLEKRAAMPRLVIAVLQG